MFYTQGIGNRITEARKRAGLSKAEVERRCPFSRQTLTAWERGDSSPGVDDLARLAALFGCDFGYLVGEYEERTRPVTDIRAETGLSPEAIEVLQALNEAGLNSVLRFISEMITFNVNNPLYGENEILIFQALSNVLHLVKLGIDSEAANRGNIVLMQDLFMDFIKDQLKQPLPDPEA